MRVTKSQLKRKLRKRDKIERCGLILNDGKIVETANIAPEPSISFRIPSDDLLKYEDQLAGTWHTHIDGDANLSAADYVGFCNWPSLTHYIIGTIRGSKEVRKYHVEAGLVVNSE